MSQTTTVRARYQIIAKVASGGMGEVYRARDSVLARDVAIKVLHRNLAGDPGFIDRFRREARAAALLSHPNIVAVHDWGSTTSGTYFMVMEFVRGRNLRDLLTHFGRLEPQQAVEVLVQMLAALEHAHRHGIVHRDVKPENVLVTPDGLVKVADFGLARAFAESRISQAPGTVTGTVQYLAPEQIQGEPADPRTDLYATGIVAYEVLTGQVPFQGETSLAIAYRHLSDRVPPPSEAEPEVPPDLDRLVVAATEKDRERRPASASDLRASLMALSDPAASAPSLGELVQELPDDVHADEDRAFTVTIPQRMSPKARRRRLLRRIVVTLMAVALLVGGGLAAWAYVIPHTTHVPRVLGMTQDAARQRLDAAGLDAQFGPPVSSTTVTEGEVLRQSLDPGTKTEKGTDVVLQLSAGLPLRGVPTVTGATLADAGTTLQAQGLKMRVRHAFSDTVRRGLIIDQNPLPGQQILFGAEVTVTVSDGREPVTVPKVVGQTTADAQSVLVAQRFHVRVSKEFSASAPVGEVIRQDPKPGGTVPLGSTVRLVVSLGPKTFPMPSVVGLPAADAQAQLEAQGLIVRVVHIPGSRASTVVGQIPDSGATVEQGETVSIFVA
ncbi:MAG: Stk1 family PASTA domain-containing Ser/Thr kinase [Actinomycetota bacterium]